MADVEEVEGEAAVNAKSFDPPQFILNLGFDVKVAVCHMVRGPSFFLPLEEFVQLIGIYKTVQNLLF